LLANAFKYTPKGTPVTLIMDSQQDLATVAVIDQGPGVPLGSREKIFEKFGQVEGATHRRPYSSGLGLTFCQLVVQKHGGQIAVDDGPGGVGSRFWFTLPLAPGR
jgi:signal transduction histidine kinase